MRTNRSGKSTIESAESRGREAGAYRNVAAHHAIGIDAGLAPEKRRLLDLAVIEAEALACETGVPELVMVTLAEEKVRATRKWFARQEQFKTRSYAWQLAA